MPPFLNPLLTIDPRKFARTPGINPNEPELPIHPAIPLPKPSPMPGGPTPVSLPEISTPTMSPIPTPAAPPAILAPERKAPELSRVGIPIPALPGETGPKQYNPIEARRYDASMQRAKRDEHGNLTGGFKRSPKDILLNALYGFGQGAQQGGLFGGLGGAAAGAIGTAVNPAAGAGYRFDIEQLPRMQAEEARTQAAIKQARDQQAADLKLEEVRQQIAKSQADVANQAGVLELDREKFKREGQKPTAYKPGDKVFRPGEDKPYIDIPLAPQRPVILPPGGAGFDPVTGAKTMEQAALPERLIPLAPDTSLASPTTGEIKTTAPGRETPVRISPAAAQAAEEAVIDKQTAEKAWATAKGLPEGEEKQKAIAAAQSAQEAYNSRVKSLGDVYGDSFETGMGEGGWAYIKSKGQQPRQARGGGAPATGGGATGPTRKLSDLTKYLQ